MPIPCTRILHINLLCPENSSVPHSVVPPYLFQQVNSQNTLTVWSHMISLQCIQVHCPILGGLQCVGGVGGAVGIFNILIVSLVVLKEFLNYKA